jgi:ribonuclease T2
MKPIVRLCIVTSVLGLLAGCKSSPPPQDRPVNQAESERATRGPMAPRSQGEVAGGFGTLAVPGSEQEAPEGGRRSRHKRGRPEAEAAPGQFDFYLLNLSWSPEYCATHQSPECGKGLGFVVHGLWPQDNTGNYPEDCSNAPGPANPQGDTDLQPTVGLVEHEWKTHGTCSGLAADAYFNLVRQAFHEVKLPAVGAGEDGNGVTPAALLARFQAANPSFPRGSFALSCGNNRLTAAEVCLTKNLQAEACPDVRSCGAQLIKVTPQ